MDRTSDRARARAGVLARLRSHIAEIERGGASRPSETGSLSPQAAAGAPSPIALWPGVFAPRGVLHDVRSGDYRDAPAALGFALGLAARIAGEAGALVLIERAHEAGSAGAIFARGLAAFGLDPARAIFIRTRTEEKALWAAEEAARAGDVAATLLVMRGRAARLTLTATRRLHLAAQKSGATPVIVRPHDPSDMTAAVMRWRVEARPSAPPAFDPRAPGAARWRVKLEKAASCARLSAADQSFLVEWRHDDKRFVLPADGRIEAAGAAHSGACLPASFDRSLAPANEGGRVAAARAS